MRKTPKRVRPPLSVAIERRSALNRRMAMAHSLLEEQLRTISTLRSLLLAALDRRRPMTVRRANRLRLRLNTAISS